MPYIRKNTLANIEQQLIRHILNDESSIRSTITDYETGGTELIRRLEDSHNDEAAAHAAISRNAASHLKDGLASLLAESHVYFERACETSQLVREYKKGYQEVVDEALGNLDRMIESWG